MPPPVGVAVCSDGYKFVAVFLCVSLRAFCRFPVGRIMERVTLCYISVLFKSDKPEKLPALSFVINCNLYFHFVLSPFFIFGRICRRRSASGLYCAVVVYIVKITLLCNFLPDNMF